MKIWKPIMEKYLADVPKTSFKSPPSRIENGKMIDVPSRFGLGIKAYTKKLEKAGFTVDTAVRLQRQRAARRLRRLVPSSGSRAPQFSTIYKLYSQGRDPQKVAAERAAKKAAAKKAAKKKAAAKKKKKSAQMQPGQLARQPARRPAAASHRR